MEKMNAIKNSHLGLMLSAMNDAGNRKRGTARCVASLRSNQVCEKFKHICLIIRHNKNLCKRCHNMQGEKADRPYNRWSESDERAWKRGVVYCWAKSESFLGYWGIVSINQAPHADCPFHF